MHSRGIEKARLVRIIVPRFPIFEGFTRTIWDLFSSSEHVNLFIIAVTKTFSLSDSFETCLLFTVRGIFFSQNTIYIVCLFSVMNHHKNFPNAVRFFVDSFKSRKCSKCIAIIKVFFL